MACCVCYDWFAGSVHRWTGLLVFGVSVWVCVYSVELRG